MTHPFVAEWAAEPRRTQPYMDWQPEVRDCDHRCPQHDAEVAGLRRLLHHMADLEELRRRSHERLEAELAAVKAANEGLRRTIDRLPKLEAS